MSTQRDSRIAERQGARKTIKDQKSMNRREINEESESRSKHRDVPNQGQKVAMLERLRLYREEKVIKKLDKESHKKPIFQPAGVSVKRPLTEKKSLPLQATKPKVLSKVNSFRSCESKIQTLRGQYPKAKPEVKSLQGTKSNTAKPKNPFRIATMEKESKYDTSNESIPSPSFADDISDIEPVAKRISFAPNDFTFCAEQFQTMSDFRICKEVKSDVIGETKRSTPKVKPCKTEKQLSDKRNMASIAYRREEIATLKVANANTQNKWSLNGQKQHYKTHEQNVNGKIQNTLNSKKPNATASFVKEHKALNNKNPLTVNSRSVRSIVKRKVSNAKRSTMLSNESEYKCVSKTVSLSHAKLIKTDNAVEEWSLSDCNSKPENSLQRSDTPFPFKSKKTEASLTSNGEMKDVIGDIKENAQLSSGSCDVLKNGIKRLPDLVLEAQDTGNEMGETWHHLENSTCFIEDEKLDMPSALEELEVLATTETIEICDKTIENSQKNDTEASFIENSKESLPKSEGLAADGKSDALSGNSVVLLTKTLEIIEVPSAIEISMDSVHQLPAEFSELKISLEKLVNLEDSNANERSNNCDILPEILEKSATSKSAALQMAKFSSPSGFKPCTPIRSCSKYRAEMSYLGSPNFMNVSVNRDLIMFTPAKIL